MTEIKFCGLTRREDAAEAVRLGASWLGVIFAGGPRNLDVPSARAVHSAAAAGVGRVGVVGAASVEEVKRLAREVPLDVVQLHADPDVEAVRAARAAGVRQVWAVVRTADDRLPSNLPALFEIADAVVLDARTAGALGGTGIALPWERLVAQVAVARRGGRGRLVLAGGLNPRNVATAVHALAPDVVDVSSGVESAPGVKDHELMRAFVSSVNGSARDP